MKAFRPAWWFGLVLGLSLGVFFTSLLLETEVLPASFGGWKMVRSGSAFAAALTAVIGGWLYRRSRA